MESLLQAKFIAGNRFNCSYYGWVGKVPRVEDGAFWIELEGSCERVPMWDLRYFRIYK